MIDILHKEDCCGCHACQTACPIGCIEMVTDNEGFLYPQVNKTLCSDCKICEETCPMLKQLPQGQPPLAYAAWCQDNSVREASSSGVIFSTLMQHTLNCNGVVFGAAFDTTMTLRHLSADNESECLKFRGSKYVQSIIGDTFKEVKSFLHQRRHVLFSGTPCQIAGLYAFLGKDDDCLLTCDVVCHGVPSPKVFAAYMADLERRQRAKVTKMSFRSKEFGWKRFSVAINFDHGREYRRILTDDPFMIGFLRDIYLRPTCHTCRFSRLPRVADISLGDFWGVAEHHPEWDDDLGTSLVLVQSPKGHAILKECMDLLVVHKADLEVAVQSNPVISGSVPEAPERTDFFRDLDNLPFESVVANYMRPPTLCHKWIKYGWKRMRRLAQCLKSSFMVIVEIFFQ